MNLAQELSVRVREQRRRILVIGDSMVDRWVAGYTTDCQDGCRKFVQEHVTETPGGAANAARSISNWGADSCSLFGFAENDCPVKTRYLEVSSLDRNSKVIFRADNDGSKARAEGYRWARDHALEMIPFARGVLLSDYDKGFLQPDFIKQVADACRKCGIPCVADCKRNMCIYDGCILKGNAEYWGSHPIPSNGVGTYGADPPVVGNEILNLNWRCVPCVNHVGAGDCFAAHLTLALAYRFSLKEAAKIAHSAGRVYVQHPYNRPPTPDEIAADLPTL